MKPQTQKVLDYLKARGSITQLQAICLGCLRLSARIADLRAAGYRVSTEYRTVDKADGTRTRIGVYHLIGEPKQ